MARLASSAWGGASSPSSGAPRALAAARALCEVCRLRCKVDLDVQRVARLLVPEAEEGGEEEEQGEDADVVLLASLFECTFRLALLTQTRAQTRVQTRTQTWTQTQTQTQTQARIPGGREEENERVVVLRDFAHWSLSRKTLFSRAVLAQHGVHPRDARVARGGARGILRGLCVLLAETRAFEGMQVAHVANLRRAAQQLRAAALPTHASLPVLLPAPAPPPAAPVAAHLPFPPPVPAPTSTLAALGERIRALLGEARGRARNVVKLERLRGKLLNRICARLAADRTAGGLRPAANARTLQAHCIRVLTKHDCSVRGVIQSLNPDTVSRVARAVGQLGDQERDLYSCVAARTRNAAAPAVSAAVVAVSAAEGGQEELVVGNEEEAGQQQEGKTAAAEPEDPSAKQGRLAALQEQLQSQRGALSALDRAWRNALARADGLAPVMGGGARSTVRQAMLRTARDCELLFSAGTRPPLNTLSVAPVERASRCMAGATREQVRTYRPSRREATPRLAHMGREDDMTTLAAGADWAEVALLEIARQCTVEGFPPMQGATWKRNVAVTARDTQALQRRLRGKLQHYQQATQRTLTACESASPYALVRQPSLAERLRELHQQQRPQQQQQQHHR